MLHASRYLVFMRIHIKGSFHWSALVLRYSARSTFHWKKLRLLWSVIPSRLDVNRKHSCHPWASANAKKSRESYLIISSHTFHIIFRVRRVTYENFKARWNFHGASAWLRTRPREIKAKKKSTKSTASATKLDYTSLNASPTLGYKLCSRSMQDQRIRQRR